jgi:hypothetical protein
MKFEFEFLNIHTNHLAQFGISKGTLSVKFNIYVHQMIIFGGY